MPRYAVAEAAPRGPTPPGKMRYTLIIDKAAHERLTRITEKHSISQSEAIETLLTKFGESEWDPIFAAVRQDKLASRSKRRQVLDKLAGLSPEQLERLAQLANR